MIDTTWFLSLERRPKGRLPKDIRVKQTTFFLSLIFALVSACEKKSETTESTQTQAAEAKADEFVAGDKADGFTAILGADPETFDTAKMSGAPEGRIAFQLFEGLMMPGPTTEGLDDPSKLVRPAMAESYELSEDGKVYTFKMRKDAKWSNGDPLTAKDFEWSWKRVLTPGFPADYAQMLWVIEGAEAYNKGEQTEWEKVGIKAVDEATLQVTLSHPTPYFPELTAFYTFFPAHQKTVETHGDDWTKPENIVSNGPYKMVSYEPQRELKMTANEHHWEASNLKIKDVRFRIITDANARVNAYKTGEVHWSGEGLPVAQITGLLTHPDFRQEPMLGTYYYRVNVSKEDSPLNDPRVRQALALSVDRTSVVENTLNNLHIVAKSFVPPMAGYQPAAMGEYDVRKAKALLAEAGFPDGKGFPEVELLYNTDENHKLVAEAIQAQWKQNLGVDIKLNNKEWKTYLQDVDTMNYQIARAGWIGDFNDPMTFLDMWVTDNGNNDTGWSNPEYDALIKEAQQTVDAKARMATLKKAETLLLEQGPVIPIYFYTNNTLVSRFIKGFEPHNRDIHLLKYMELEK